jgi:hypothetical protein
MKKLVLLLIALPCLLLMSCHRHGNIHINYKDRDDTYSMKARFDPERTPAIDRYMNRAIGDANHIAFQNISHSTIRLQNGAIFNIDKSPGHMEINLKKSENSDYALHHMKRVCEGVKGVLVR